MQHTKLKFWYIKYQRAKSKQDTSYLKIIPKFCHVKKARLNSVLLTFVRILILFVLHDHLIYIILNSIGSNGSLDHDRRTSPVVTTEVSFNLMGQNCK